MRRIIALCFAAGAAGTTEAINTKNGAVVFFHKKNLVLVSVSGEKGCQYKFYGLSGAAMKASAVELSESFPCLHDKSWAEVQKPDALETCVRHKDDAYLTTYLGKEGEVVLDMNQRMLTADECFHFNVIRAKRDPSRVESALGSGPSSQAPMLNDPTNYLLS